jgi:hypothetical protein
VTTANPDVTSGPYRAVGKPFADRAASGSGYRIAVLTDHGINVGMPPWEIARREEPLPGASIEPRWELAPSEAFEARAGVLRQAGG